MALTASINPAAQHLREFYIAGTTVGTGERVELDIGVGATLLFVQSAFSGGTVSEHTPKLYDSASGGRIVWEATWAGGVAGLVGTWNATAPGMYLHTVQGKVWYQPSPDTADGTLSGVITVQVR